MYQQPAKQMVVQITAYVEDLRTGLDSVYMKIKDARVWTLHPATPIVRQAD